MDISIFIYRHRWISVFLYVVSYIVKYQISNSGQELHAFILFNVKNLFECKLLALANVVRNHVELLDRSRSKKLALYEIQYVLLKSINYMYFRKETV